MKVKSLTAAVTSRDQTEVLRSAQLDMAKRLAAIESGRDYAAVMKSFIDVTEKLVELDADCADAARPANLLAQAKAKQLRVVGE